SDAACSTASCSIRRSIAGDRKRTAMSALWRNDEELFPLARRELFTAVVGDTMDGMGLRRQFLPPQIQPLRRDMVAIGRAMTVLEADFFDAAPSGSRNPLSAAPFGMMFDALDDL